MELRLTKSRDHKEQGLFAKRPTVWWDQNHGLDEVLGWSESLGPSVFCDP